MSWQETIERRPIAAYGLALGSLAAVVALRWLLDPLLGDTMPLVTLYGAVAAAVWAGGYRPAAVVAVLGYFICSFLLVVPRGERHLDEAGWVDLLAYFFTCAILVAFGEALRSAQRSTARENSERLAAARRLAAIVESSADAIVSKTLDGTILSWNRGAQRLFGYTAEQAVGRHISFIIPAERAAEEDQILARLRAGERIDHFDTVRIRSDGQPINVSLTVSPIKDERGAVVGASKIARDITERKLAEEALREADRRKTEFLAVLSHELRGPLAPLRSALAVMKRPELEAGVLAEARATMERQLSQLVRLVEDLFDVGRGAHDKLELRRETVELASIARHAVEACRPLIEGAEQLLEVVLPSEPIYLDADPARLAQVFGNLLNNASKFTPAGGHVSLTAERQGDAVVVTVEDDGVGIPESEIGRVFEMFTQVDRNLERSQGGLGIGLTLVKRLVDLHGGTVTASSEGPGRGSAFAVRLPAIAAPPAEVRPKASAVAAEAKPGRFLVVDDNVDSAASLALLLTLTGHQARTAHDGLEAVKAAEEYRPEVVLLDIGLPQLNGYEACRRIREAPWGKEMVLVALTGWGQEDDRRKSKEAGFDHHLVKPVDYDQLMSLLAG